MFQNVTALQNGFCRKRMLWGNKHCMDNAIRVLFCAVYRNL